MSAIKSSPKAVFCFGPNGSSSIREISEKITRANALTVVVAANLYLQVQI